jgi:hypothetical protein
MPHFDTRGPRKQKPPIKLRIAAIANKLRSPLMSIRLSTLLISAGIVPLVVVVVGVGVPVGAYLLSATAAERDLDDLPQYRAEYQNDEADCFPYTVCYDVYTTATDMKVLALIGERIIIFNGYHDDRVVVSFDNPHDASSYSATAYYSGHKGPPKEVMSQGSWDQATVWHDIYVVDGESELNPYVWWYRIYGFWHRIFGS